MDDTSQKADTMSEETYRAMRAYIDLAVELRVEKKLTELRSATELKTPEPVVGPPGKDGKDGKDGEPGKDGAPSTAPGPKGDTGERGADGIATREEVEEVVERKVADVQTRSLADYHRRTYQPGESYKRGDLTVWDGTTWLAMADTIAAPGSSPDWQQFAKKGRDGRDRK